jgi:hypothetical protein
MSANMMFDWHFFGIFRRYSMAFYIFLFILMFDNLKVPLYFIKDFKKSSFSLVNSWT